MKNPTIENRTTLEIELQKVVTGVELSYFVTIQLDGDGEKKRTDISKKSRSPEFKENKFYLELNHYNLMINQRVIFALFIVVDAPGSNSGQGGQEAKGVAKLLGECILDLNPLTKLLNDINDVPVKQSLEFVRRQGEKDGVVGRFNVTLRLLSDKITVDDEAEATGINDGITLLPEMDVVRSFVWRMRVDVRSGVNLPFNRTTEGGLPSYYCEMGWTMYSNRDINLAESVRSTIIESNRHPIWNHQLLYYPPSSVQTYDGFFQIYLKDKFQSQPIQKIIMPINTFKPYHPIHLEFKIDPSNRDDVHNSFLYMSFTLEDFPEYKLSDSLVNIVIHNVIFDPIPVCTDRVSIMMTTEKWKPTDIEYKTVELQSDSHLVNVLIAHKTDPYSMFVTNTFRIPIIKEYYQNQFGAIASFIVPRSFMSKSLMFYVLVRNRKVITNHSMPNSIAGIIDIVSDDLMQTSYFSKTHDIIKFKVNWDDKNLIYPSIAHNKCVAEFSVRKVEEIKSSDPIKTKDFDYDQIKQDMMKNAVQGNFII